MSNEVVFKLAKRGLAGAIVVVLAGPALCQIPEASDASECGRAAERLNAPSDREKAWGAHLAAVCHLPVLAPEIAAQLDHTRLDMFERTVDVSGRTIWGTSQWSGYAMLGALIQLRRPLEASALASIARRFPTEATILMLQDAPGNQSLLAAVREGPVSHPVWVAASNALARLRVPGFAAALLQELHLINSVVVLDAGKAPRGYGGSGMGRITSTQLPPGFPPIRLYSLTTKWAPGEELASDGPTPIYLQRLAVDTSHPINWPISWPWEELCNQCQRNCPECQRERAEYLAGLAHLPTAEVHLAIHPVLIVEWSTPAQLVAAISRSIAEQRTGMKRLVAQLASVGALENSEPGVTFRLEIQIEDERNDQSISLPQYPPVELRLQ